MPFDLLEKRLKHERSLFLNSRDDAESQLKISFLLFDELYMGQAKYSPMADVAMRMIFDDSDFSKSEEEEFKSAVRWYDYSFPEGSIVKADKVKEVKKLCTEIVNEELIKHYGSGAEDDFIAEKVIDSASEGILDWMLLLQGEPCALIGDNLEMNIFKKIATDWSSQNALEAKTKLLTKKIAPLAWIDWKSILSLRKHSDLVTFRKRLFEISSDPYIANGEDVLKILDDEYNKGLRELAVKNRKGTSGTIVRSVAANIPGLLVNPYSVYLGIKDSVDAYNDNKKYGWLYYMIALDEYGPES